VNSILITGGTGYFGRRFAAAALGIDVERVCIFSRDEHKQAEMRETFGNDSHLRFFIGDVRDRDRLRQAMHGTDVVVHAAALKRIETGYYNPIEMVKTNVLGAVNVIEAAVEAGVERVVALSTDKAFQPISAYGHSKAMAESLFLAANQMHGSHGPKFSVCRYGNIAGATGSVIPRWRENLARGEPFRVTDLDCTRFWMTITQAIDFVFDTLEGMPADVSVPVLPAYRLGDLAQAMMGPAGYTVTGLPAWEKRHESMNEIQSSDRARRMTLEEIKEEIDYV